MAVLFGMGVGLIYGGLFAVAAGTLVLSLAQTRPALLARLKSTRHFTALATGLLYVGILYWGLVGGLFGALFYLAEALASRGVWGIPNLAYTAAVTALTALIAVPALLLMRVGRTQVALLAAAFAIAFGWLVPLLGF